MVVYSSEEYIPFGVDDDRYEPVFGDRNYDYGETEDGYVIHEPCIICGVAGGNCTEDLHI